MCSPMFDFDIDSARAIARATSGSSVGSQRRDERLRRLEADHHSSLDSAGDVVPPPS